MYAITRTAHHYAGTFGADDRPALYVELYGEVVHYPAREAAQGRIAQLETGDAYLAHGEYATPTYRVVRVASRAYRRAAERSDEFSVGVAA